MSKLKDRFSFKEWRECCCDNCEDCIMARTYIKKYGKKEAKKKMKRDKTKITGS